MSNDAGTNKSGQADDKIQMKVTQWKGQKPKNINAKLSYFYVQPH